MSTTKYIFNPFTGNLDAEVATIDLTTDVTGILPIANGGTGMSTALPPGSTLYADSSRTDSYTADGTIGKPFKTISAALSQIITNNDGISYAVVAAPGTYTETINLNNTAFTRISIVTKDIVNGMLSNDAIPVTSLVGDIVSTSNNDNLKALKIDGFDIQGNINFVGASNGSNFLTYGGTIANCVLYSTGATGITVNNAGQYVMQNCSHIIQSGAGAISVQNVNSFLCYSSFISAGALSIVTNNAVNKPSGFAGTTSQFSFGSLGSAATIDAGSSFTTRFNRVTATISNSGTMSSVGAVFTAVVTANSGATWTSNGDNFSTVPNVSAITFTPIGNKADKAHFLGTYNPVSSGVNLAIGASSASTIGEIIKLAATPTADALQIQDSTAAVLAKLDSTGKIFVPNANVSSLTASSPILTDASKNLISGNIALASQVSGILPVANGGTGLATLTAHDVLIGNGTGNVTLISPSTSGFVLTSNGTGADPSFQALSATITSWASATVTGSFTTNTSYSCKSRQVGDSKEYMVVVTFSGAPNSTNFTLTLPSGDTIDTTKLPDTTSSDGSNLGPVLGNGELMDTGNQSWGTCAVAYFSSTQVTMYSASESPVGNGKTKIIAQDTPFTFGNTDKISLRFTVPIV